MQTGSVFLFTQLKPKLFEEIVRRYLRAFVERFSIWLGLLSFDYSFYRCRFSEQVCMNLKQKSDDNHQYK
jgi:hypothetical protein